MSVKVKGDGRVVPVETLLRIRAALIQGEPPLDVARRFRVSEYTVLRTSDGELPKARCPDCGGRVTMPCLKCLTDRNKQLQRIAADG